MPASLDCPGADCWDALFGDTVAPEQRERYERHLESCPACQERLDRSLEGRDVLVGLVRQVGDPTTLQTEPALAEVLDRLHDVRSPLRPAPVEPADLYFLRPADRPDLLGTLGNYEVEEVIGEGGMGVVLKAFDPALHRPVAIKVMAAAVAGSATARRRFTREAQAAAAVCHDHVVTVHGVNEADGLPYLVMQYVAGESLQARIDRTGPLDVVEIVRIGMQTASGLAAAHAQGLIHRDIKPANLLLENGLARVKITDFGLARMVDDVGLTQAGVVSGTPEYMAPEQARGEPVDHRADLFSLGSVLYAMCTGMPPFRGPSAVAVLRRVSDEEPNSVRSVNPDVSAWLEAVIARLMAKDPAARFQSAAEVAALLEGYLAHLRQPTTVLPPELPPSPGESQPAPSTPSQGRVGPRGPHPLWLVALLVAITTWGLFRWLPAADGPAAQNAAPGEFSYDFRGKKLPPPEMDVWTGKDGDETIEPEEKGLRITLAAGRKRTDPVGLVMNTTVKGNFEITTGYEILQANKPREGFGVGYELYIRADTPTQDAIAFARVKLKGGEDEYLCNRLTTVDGKRKSTLLHFKTTSTSGRLRLTRRGGEVTYWVAEGDAAEFRELGRHGFGPDDVKMVRTCAYTGTAPEAVDIRLVDVRVRSDAPLPELAAAGAPATDGKPGGMKKGFALAVALGLALTVSLVALGTWFFLARRGRGTAKDPAPRSEKEEGGRCETASPFVSFTCPRCGSNVKAKAEQAGMKGKCPKCAKAVLVPGAAVTTQPNSSLPRGSGGGEAMLVPGAGGTFPGSTRGGKAGKTSILKKWWFYVPPALLLVLLAALAGWWVLRSHPADSQPGGEAEGRSFLNVRLGYQPDPDIEESGFYFQESFKGQPFRWTDGHGRLLIPLLKGESPRALEVKLEAHRPPGARAALLDLRVNDQKVFEGAIPLGKWDKTFDLAGIDLGAEVVVDIKSDTFTPAGNRRPDGKVSDDARSLGVQVRGVTLLSTMPEPPQPLGPVVDAAKPPANDEGVVPPGVIVWRGHGAGVSCGAVTPDGKTLVSGSWDGTIKVWDVAGNRERQTFPGKAPNVSAIAISPNGATFATAASDQTVRVWETETGKPLAELRGPAGQIANLALAYSPDGKTLAAAGGQRGRLGELMLWDWQGAKEAPVVEQPFKLRQWCVAFSPDGKYVAVGGGDGTVSVVDVGTGKSRAAFSLPKYVRCVSFSPDGKRLAASYGDQGRLSLYEWEAAKQLCDFQAPVAKLVLGATFSPDGKTLLTPYGDGTAILWDASAVPPRILGTLNSGARQSWFVLFFPDGRTVATGSDDGTIRLMKVDNPK